MFSSAILLLSFFLSLTLCQQQQQAAEDDLTSLTLPPQLSQNDTIALSPDTNTPSIRGKGRKVAETPGQYHFLSSVSQMTGYDDTDLHATILPADHIHAILTHAAAELQAHYLAAADAHEAPFWQFNYTDWSLAVWGDPEATIHYTLITAVVRRLLVLLGSPTTEALTWARVGRIEDADRKVIASVAFTALTPVVETVDVVGAAGDETNTDPIFGPTAPDPKITYFGANGTRAVAQGAVNASALLDWVNTTAVAVVPEFGKRGLANLDKRTWFTDSARTLGIVATNGMAFRVLFQVWDEGIIAGDVYVIGGSMLWAAVATWHAGTVFEDWKAHGVANPRLASDDIFPVKPQLKEYHVGRMTLRVLFRMHDEWREHGKGLHYVDLMYAFLRGLEDHLKSVPIDQPVPGFRAGVYVDVPDSSRPKGSRPVKVMDADVTVRDGPRANYRDEL